MSSSLPLPGSLIARKYAVVGQLGEGGMGVILEAENTVTGKRVVIKWLRPELAGHPHAAQRLIREAQASSRVRHPNVVDVYDVARDGDALFIVMEYLEGESLDARLRRGPLPVHRLIALLLPAMRGVLAAHRAGIVHRDIKPANIFLAREPDQDKPVPKVLDFGISKVIEVQPLDLTQTGVALGTPRYMSYEQIIGLKDIDDRVDVYGFGVILYEAICGQPPFSFETLAQLAVQMATLNPTFPAHVREHLPQALERLVLRALERQREQRITLEILIRELEPFADEHSFDLHLSADGERLRSAEDCLLMDTADLPTPPDRVLTSTPALTSRNRPRSRIVWGLALSLLTLAAAALALHGLGPSAPVGSEEASDQHTRAAAARAAEGSYLDSREEVPALRPPEAGMPHDGPEGDSPRLPVVSPSPSVEVRDSVARRRRASGKKSDTTSARAAPLESAPLPVSRQPEPTPATKLDVPSDKPCGQVRAGTLCRDEFE